MSWNSYQYENVIHRTQIYSIFVSYIRTGQCTALNQGDSVITTNEQDQYNDVECL